MTTATDKIRFSPNAESISSWNGVCSPVSERNYFAQLLCAYTNTFHFHESQFTISITSDANRGRALLQNVATNKCVMVDYPNQIPPPDGWDMAEVESQQSEKEHYLRTSCTQKKR